MTKQIIIQITSEPEINSTTEVQHYTVICDNSEEINVFYDFLDNIEKLKGTRTCTGCNKEKRLTEFGRDTAHKDGRQERCKECVNNYVKDWRKTHIVKKSREQKRKPKEENRELTHERLCFIKDFWKHCAYCKEIFVREPHLEHVIPLSLKKGGKHAVDNVVMACIRCNAHKHTKTAQEFGYMPIFSTHKDGFEYIGEMRKIGV